MISLSSLRLPFAALIAALIASPVASAAEPDSGRLRMLDSDSSTLTLQPGALGYYQGAELSTGLATQLDPQSPAQSWDLRLAGGSDGIAGGLLLRQDLKERWWSGYGLGVAMEWVSLGVTAQRSGLPLWATKQEQSSTRIDAGLGLRPASWLSVGYNVGRSTTDGADASADQRLGLAVRNPGGVWGAESALELDGVGALRGPNWAWSDGSAHSRFGSPAGSMTRAQPEAGSSRSMRWTVQRLGWGRVAALVAPACLNV